MQLRNLAHSSRRLLIHADYGSVGLVDRDPVKADEEPGVARGRRCCGDDGELDQAARVLAGIDSAVDDGTVCASETLQIHAESSAVDEALLREVVDEQRISAVPAAGIGTGAQYTDTGAYTIIRHAKDLLSDSGRSDADIIRDILKVDITGAITSRSADNVVVACYSVVDQGGGLRKPGLGRAKGFVGGCGANWIDPEFVGPGVKLDRDRLARSTNGQVDGIDGPGALAKGTDAILSSFMLAKYRAAFRWDNWVANEVPGIYDAQLCCQRDCREGGGCQEEEGRCHGKDSIY